QSRHNANLRIYARGRPQRRHRFRSRILNFGVFSSFAIFAVVAMSVSALILTFSLDHYAARLLCGTSSPRPRRLRGAKRHTDELQELSRLCVGLGRRDHRYVHTASLVDFHVIDFRKDQLIAQAERVVAPTVESLRRDPFEVADAREGNRHQPVEEFPHPLAAQRDHRRDGHSLAHLEGGNRLFRTARDRLLAGYPRQLVGADIDQLRVGRRLTQAHVHHDLFHARDGHDVLVAELFGKSRHDFLLVLVPQPAHLSTTPSQWRQIRTLRPSPRILRPTRVCAPHSGQTSWTFDACRDASRATMPPLTFLPGFGLVWRLIRLTPSTTSRFLSGRIFKTRPRLPRSFPVMTSTVSFFRIGVAKRDIRNLYSTSGASEMIFMKRRSRSSRATGPKTRVPIGSPWSLTRTAAFRSNRM